MADLTYETVLHELYADVPEFAAEIAGDRSWVDPDEQWEQYAMIDQLPGWLCEVARERREDVLDRASRFLERACCAAARDQELENLLLLQLGEGAPLTPTVWSALGPKTRDLVTRGNAGRVELRPE